MSKRRFRLVALVVLMAVILLLCRVERRAYGVWDVSVPGLSVTALRDSYIGPVLWFYTGERFLGQWKAGQWHSAETKPSRTPPPTYTPYPTSTPYPTATRGLPLQGA